MHINFRMVTVSILGILASGSSFAIDVGNYTGQGVNGETLKLSVTSGRTVIEVTTEGCVGDATGKLQSVGTGRWQMRPDWPGCVIDFQVKGGSIVVTESSECFQLHGAMCSFNGRLAGGRNEANVVNSPATTTATNTWTYGEDPELGLSAHIRTEQGAVGIACLADGTNPATSEIVALRMTSSLIAPNGSVYMFDGFADVRDISRIQGKPYGELRDTTCGVSLQAFRAARHLFIAEGKVGGIAKDGNKLAITIDQANEQTIVSDGADLASKLSTTSIPLKGSSAAIKSFLTACQAARADVEAECGL